MEIDLARWPPVTVLDFALLTQYTSEMSTAALITIHDKASLLSSWMAQSNWSRGGIKYKEVQSSGYRNVVKKQPAAASALTVVCG